VNARILFVHIPKTAGMSLYHALERWASPERAIRFPNGGPEDLAAWLGLPQGRVDELRVVSGHLPLHAFRRRDLSGWSAITLLRDPVARTLSTYSYIQGQRSHPWHEQVSAMDLEAFLDWFEARPANLDQQCGFIAPERTAEAALRVLRNELLLAGTVERLAVFDEALSGVLGASIRTPRHNRSRRPIDPDRLTASTIERIHALHPEDSLLHREVLRIGLVGTASGTSPGRAEPTTSPDAGVG
jgi:hypothetical protein